MNKCEVASVTPVARRGFFFELDSSFSSALARGFPSFRKCAPDSSAKYSRLREIESCISIAAIGARIVARIRPTMPKILLSSRSENAEMRAKRATYDITPAMVAAIVLIRISRFFTCAISCARTPLSSSRERSCIIPSVTATTAF